MINGIDESAIRALASAIQRDPGRGATRFFAITEWRDGAHSTSSVRHFTVPADEPASLGGTDLAPNAVELLLSALGACLTVGFIYNAAVQGIAVRMLAIEIEGRIDLARFLGLPVETPAGYAEIRVDCRIDADVRPEVLAALVARVVATSPVTDTLRRPVPIAVTVNGEPAG